MTPNSFAGMPPTALKLLSPSWFGGMSTWFIQRPCGKWAAISLRNNRESRALLQRGTGLLPVRSMPRHSRY